MRPVDYLRLLLLSAIWGASFLFMRILVPSIGTVPAAFSRVLLATVGLAVILMFLGVRWNFRNRLRPTLVLGIINSGIPFLMYSFAAGLLPAGYSAIFNAMTPLMGVLVGRLFFGERPTFGALAGVVLGVCGVAVLTRSGPVPFTASVALGATACLAATVCYAAAGFLTRRWITDREPLDPKLIAFGSQIGATAFLLPFMAGAPGLPVAALFTAPNVLLAALALGLACTAWAYVLYFRLIADIGPARSLTVTFMVPLFGVVWGALLLDEQLSMAHLWGGGLVFLAVLLAQRTRQGAPARAGAAAQAQGSQR